MAGTPGTGRTERGRAAAGSRRRRGARSARPGRQRRPAGRRSAALGAGLGAPLSQPPSLRRLALAREALKGPGGRASCPPPALPPATGRGRRRERAGRRPRRPPAPGQGRSGAAARGPSPQGPARCWGSAGGCARRSLAAGSCSPALLPRPADALGQSFPGVKACSGRVAS